MSAVSSAPRTKNCVSAGSRWVPSTPSSETTTQTTIPLRTRPNGRVLPQPPKRPTSSVIDISPTSLRNNDYGSLNRPFRLHHLASSNGGTVIRPVFFEYPHDTMTYNLGYQFMWGPSIMVAPVVYQVPSRLFQSPQESSGRDHS